MSKKIINRRWWAAKRPGRLYQQRDGDIVRCDALAGLNALRDRCADIVFLDPPFNLGKAYGKNGSHGDLKKEDEYMEYMGAVIARAAALLKDGGAMYLYHIPKWAIRLSQYLEKELSFRHWIAISMKNGFARGKRLYPAHYALLYYTKGDPAQFSRPKVPRPVCGKCKRDLRDYGGYKEFVKNGINLSDIWDDMTPVRHKKFKTRVANELPVALLDRVLTISGVQGGVIVDPFAGSGTTAVAARGRRMKFVACDSEDEYCRLMVKRLREMVKKEKADERKHG